MTMCVCVCVQMDCVNHRVTPCKKTGKREQVTQAICNYSVSNSITIQFPQGNIKTCICKFIPSQSSKEVLFALSPNNTEITSKELWQQDTITKLAHCRARRFAILCLTCIYQVYNEFYLHYM